ncbi:MAG: glycosyltransferase family 4 protein [archaeon]
MKVAIIAPYFSGFGCNESELAEEFTNLGHKITIFKTDIKKGSRLEFFKDFKEPEYRVIKVPVIFNFRGWPLTKNFSDKLKDFDLIMAQEDYQYMSYIAFLASKKYNIKYIVSNERYISPKFPKSIFLEIIEFLFSTKIRKYANYITVHANSAKEYLLKKGVKKEIKIIPTPINLEKFNQFKSIKLKQIYNFKEKDIVILSQGRLVYNKNYELLIKKFKDLPKNYKLVIVGMGVKKDKLLSIIKENNLDNIFIYDKFVNHEDMPKFINSCDIYIQPSINEPFGIVVREAMACGKPIIVTKIGGMADAIEDNGIYLNNDLSNLREAIDYCYKNRNELSINSLKAVKKYDVKKICKEYLNLIK